MTSSLPRYVTSFLRQMEPYKEHFKWSITEGSHKITLTLSWNFKKTTNQFSSPGDDQSAASNPGILSRLQETLNIGTQTNNTQVPEQVREFLQLAPKKHKRTPLRRKLSMTMGALKRTLATPADEEQHIPTGVFYTSQRAAPAAVCLRSNSFTHARQVSNYASVRAAIPRYNSYHGQPISYTLPTSPSQASCTSGAGYSGWTTGSVAESHYSEPLGYSGTPRAAHRRVRLTYRSQDEIEQSIEDMTAAQRRANQQRMEKIRHEWNQSILAQTQPRAKSLNRTCYSLDTPMPPPPPNVFEMTQSSSDTDLRGGSSNNSDQNVNTTLVRCLDSCDKILQHFETEIT